MFFNTYDFTIKPIFQGVKDPISQHFRCPFLFSNAEFDLQNTALSGPRVCSAYLNLYDLRGKQMKKHYLEKNCNL